MGRFDMSLQELESSAHVPVDEQVEELDVAPLRPPLKADEDRERESLLRVGIPGL